MKHYHEIRHRSFTPCRSSCPVKCPVCHHDRSGFPARFNRGELGQGKILTGMEDNSNHIIFVFEGELGISSRMGDNYRLTAGHCMFLSRESEPVIRAVSTATVMWLDFSNRPVLCRHDCLDSITAGVAINHIHIPVLPIDPVLMQIIKEMPMIDSPCYHLLKEYDLFMIMRERYSERELALFFKDILRPARDMRAFVMSNYRQAKSIKDFAWRANLSESTFVRRFREVFGMSVHQWMMKQKEKDLCEMIANGERDTNKLAEGIGLGNQASLYQFCRRRFGCSVTEIIKRYGL